jgi:hypothetical protein
MFKRWQLSGILRVRLAGHVAYIGEMINVYTILVGKPEENIPPPKQRSR